MGGVDFIPVRFHSSVGGIIDKIENKRLSGLQGYAMIFFINISEARECLYDLRRGNFTF
jgi:hypothetical protein